MLAKLSANKKLTASESMIARSLDRIKEIVGPSDTKYLVSYKALVTLFEQLDDNLYGLMDTLSACKLATVLYNSWWTGTTVNDKGDEIFQPFPEAYTMVIKSARTKVYC